MVVQAGNKIRASDVGFVVENAAATAGLTLSTTATDITGATVTFTTVNDDVDVLIIGTFDAQCNTVSGSTVIQGFCVVDGGAAESGVALFLATASAQRATVVQTWKVTLAAAGSHTIKLQGNKTAAVGTYTIVQTHTKISVLVLDTPA